MPTVLIVDDNAELANLLAVVAESSGIETRLAYSGREALGSLENLRPDAALVDLLLPDMRGHDVLRRLSTLGIPCFAMSGVFRGEGLVREAIEDYGAKGFFEKPFVARELMERLLELLAGAEPALAARSGSEQLEELQLDDDGEGPAGCADEVPALDDLATPETTGIFRVPLEFETGPSPAPESTAQCDDSQQEAPPSAGTNAGFDVEDAAVSAPCIPVEGGHASLATDGASERLAPVGTALPQAWLEGDEAERESSGASPKTTAILRASGNPVSEASASAVLPFSGRDVWRPLDRSASTPASQADPLEKEGRLSGNSMPRLLTALFLGQQTGELRVKRQEIVKIIGFHRGQPVSAASNLGSEHFARFAVRAGRLQETKLAFVQEEARNAGMRISEAMVALGLISEEERCRLVERQVKQIIWSTFDWTDGEHQFVPRASPRSDKVKVSLSPGPLILEGIRATFPLVRLRELVPASLRFFPTADPPYQLQDLALGDREALLLAHADGSKTVDDLVVLSDLSEREALALLHGLAQTGILEPRGSAPRRSRVVLV